MAEDVTKTEQAGFLAHLVKPINFEQLNRVPRLTTRLRSLQLKMWLGAESKRRYEGEER
jgi:hypothetical protein